MTQLPDGASSSAPWSVLADPRRRRRNVKDRIAAWVVGAGGLATIGSVLAILVFIAVEAGPLWSSSRAGARTTIALPVGVAALAAGSDEYRAMLQLVGDDGIIRFLDLDDGAERARFAFPGLGEERVLAATRPDGRHFVLLTARRMLAARVDVVVSHAAAGRQLEPRVEAAGEWILPESVAPSPRFGASVPDGGSLTAVVVDVAGTPWMIAVRETESFAGDVERQETFAALTHQRGPIVVLHVDARGTQAFLGTEAGRVERWDLRDVDAPQQTDDVAAATQHGAGISALAPLIGNQSLVVGDSSGGIGVWFSVRQPDGPARLQRVHDFAPHAARVTALAASPRHRGFVSGDAAGVVRLHHATTAQTLLSLEAAGSADRLVFAPKADGVIALGAAPEASHWSIDSPHPEISLRALFGKVWYEGYEQPEYVWQSTGGTDAFEPKLSLVPLIVGTMKGTLYALLFAVPIAVLAALYTSQFSDPRVRAIVKPTVETMAALPSVVLGFLAGLWLAPLLETKVPALIAALIVVPCLIFASALVWHGAPARIRGKMSPVVEVLVLGVLVVVAMQVSIALNGPIERMLFGGDFRAWLHEAGWRFDQRNNIVVGFAMGFAVIPIIFTISEDALANVPQRLVSASLALGATPWQTALRVVVPTASPGIFSAVMIGFGRAVGETMIVLMATGNTPVLDWSIFTGMRTLSANIAVEIPEAPHGGTLYRVLFLAALLLFMVTFVVNTAAEIVRQRLRRRYQEM